MVVYWKKLKHGVTAVVAVWIFALTLLPEITPTPIKVAEVAYDKIQPLVAQFQWDAPYQENIASFPYLSYKRQVTIEKAKPPVAVTYVFPASGFNAVAITANTNIQPYPLVQSGKANI